jgi:diacylglycerol kinase family enzyme
MMFSHGNFDNEKTELVQTDSVEIRSTSKVHFQVDGEYLGKLTKLTASIEPAQLNLLLP